MKRITPRSRSVTARNGDVTDETLWDVPGRSRKLPWYRAYIGLPSHPKWKVIARRAGVHVSAVFHLAMYMMDTAAVGTPRGSIEGFDPEEASVILDQPVEVVKEIEKALRQALWIEGHMISTWDKRQPIDPTGAIRQQRFRDKHTEKTGKSKTRRYAPLRNGDSNTDVTASNHQIRDKKERKKEEESSEDTRARTPVDNPEANLQVAVKLDEGQGGLARALFGSALDPPEETPSKPVSELTGDEVKGYVKRAALVRNLITSVRSVYSQSRMLIPPGADVACAQWVEEGLGERLCLIMVSQMLGKPWDQITAAIRHTQRKLNAEAPNG